MFFKFIGVFRQSDIYIVSLVYFFQSKICMPSTLWCVYSKVKCMVKVKENIDISFFSKVFDFLKKLSVGYKPKKRFLTFDIFFDVK